MMPDGVKVVSSTCDVSSSNKVGGTNARSDHNKEDPSSFATRCLYYLEEEEEGSNLPYMITPSNTELKMPLKSDKSILSPGLGNPELDPAYTNCLQNPDSNGVCFKGYGHFEGYDASYLVNRQFLDVYDNCGYKVFCFFPRVRIKHDDLEKQDMTRLYGSLMQTQEDINLGEVLFHDAQEDIILGEPIFLNAHEDLLPGDEHYFDPFYLNMNEMVGFIGQNPDLDGLDGVFASAGSDADDKDGEDTNSPSSDHITSNTNMVDNQKRGDDVLLCHLKSWVRCGMLVIQPLYTLVVRYGTQKKLTRWAGQIDWIKHYLEDLDGVTSVV